MRRLLVLLLVAAALCSAPAVLRAHHSVSGQFDTTRLVTLTGVVSKIDWINPHIYVHLDVKDDRGGVTTWALETLPTAMMRRAGITRETLGGKPGEVIAVEAVPARDGTKHLAWISKITYADGRVHQLGGN